MVTAVGDLVKSEPSVGCRLFSIFEQCLKPGLLEMTIARERFGNPTTNEMQSVNDQLLSGRLS
jgi:hypothetical protein